MSWWQLGALSRYPDFAEEVLLAQGATSVTQTDAGDYPLLEPAPGETPMWPRTLSCGLFSEESALDPAAAALRAALPDGAEIELRRSRIEDADWINAWLVHAKPLRFGAADARGLWVCPSGHRIDEHEAVIVQLDPGLAFGTGTHPSTALCLDWLARHAVSGRRVLDYGCGSGILAIAALKLGAVHALAVDIDQQALTATRDNAERNHVAARLSCADASENSAGAVDLVLANILARPLIALAPALAARVAPGGGIVLAGILADQAAEVRAAYGPWFDFEADELREGWVRIAGRRGPRVAGRNVTNGAFAAQSN